MEMIQVLTRLVEAFGPSGCEHQVSQVIEELARPYVDEISRDTLGNLICHKKGSGPKVMFSAHMDSIGLVATHIDEKGFVHVGVNNLAAEYILKVAIDTFSDRNPVLTITMSRVDLKRVEESLCNGWLDFVLYIDMDDEPTGSDFLAETQLMKQEVGDFPDACLVGARYAYLAQRPHTPGELAALPLIIPLEAHDASRYYLKLLRGTESATPIDITVDGAQSRLALARRNLGLTHFPAAFVRDQLSRRELFVVKSDLPMRNNVVSVFSAGEELPNLAAQKLMETLLQFKK